MFRVLRGSPGASKCNGDKGRDERTSKHQFHKPKFRVERRREQMFLSIKTLLSGRGLFKKVVRAFGFFCGEGNGARGPFNRQTGGPPHEPEVRPTEAGAAVWEIFRSKYLLPY